MPNIFDQLAAEQQPQTSGNIFDQLAAEAKTPVPTGAPGGYLPSLPSRAPVPDELRIGSQSPQQIIQQQTGIHPFKNPAAQVAAGVGRTAAGIVEAPLQAIASGFKAPTNQGETEAQQQWGPLGLAFQRNIVEPAEAAHSTANELRSQGHPLLAAGAELGALPVIGPLGQSLGQRAAAGDIPGALTEGVLNAFTPKLLDRGGEAIQASRPANAMNLPGENFNPFQHRALSAVLARGTGMGKDFISPDVARDIASPLRQAAADAPAKVQAIMQGSPQDALGATQSLLNDAKIRIDTQHQAALQPVANTPVDMTPVQDAIPDPKAFHDETEKAAIQNLRDRAGKVKTLSDLNDFRQYLGEENSSTFGKNTVAANNGSVAAKALNAADAAARDHYYDQLQQATGLDFQPLKRTESSILKAQEALSNVGPSLVNKYALANEPRDLGSLQGLGSTAADVLQGSKALGGGLPLVSYAAEKLRPAPIEQVQSGLRNVFSNLPEPSQYRGPLTSTWSPAPRGLPANAPGNAPFGAPSQAAGSTGPTPQATVTPAPVQAPQLPAQAGPEGQGIPQGQVLSAPTTVIPPRGSIPLPAQFGQPLLGTGEGNPEFVTPQPSTPPAFNPETARMNVNAGTPRPVQEQIPQRTINVSPEGAAAIQRPALPSPATHVFDPASFQRANPNANIQDAIAIAKLQGYAIDPAWREFGPVQYATNPQGQRVAVQLGSDGRWYDSVTKKPLAQSSSASRPIRNGNGAVNQPKLTKAETVLIRKGGGQVANDSTMRAYLKLSGDDKVAARQALTKDGWKIGK